MTSSLENSTSPEPERKFVVGLDPSLASSGIVATDLISGDIFEHLVKTVKRSPKGKTDTIYQMCSRHDEIVEKTITAVMQCDPILVVVETLMFTSANDQSAVRRGGIWWSVISYLVAQGIPIVGVTPGQVKKFATGRGTVKKEHVVLAAGRTWTDMELATNDIADAAWMSAMGVYELGGTSSVSKTQYRDDVLEGIAWPDNMPERMVPA